MNLVVDAGNTRLKYAFFDDGELLEVKYRADDLFRDIRKWREERGRVDLLLSGSGDITEGMRATLKESVDWCVDAICTGALGLYPGHPLLVIDSGTCITFNYVDAEGMFLGGNISPGLEMRFKGLRHFTARLPLVEASERYGGMGHTTEEAIRNGVMDGMLFEVENYIRRFLETFDDGRVLLTGGNSYFLENHLKENVEFCKILGFIGLNRILDFAKKA